MVWWNFKRGFVQFLEGLKRMYRPIWPKQQACLSYWLTYLRNVHISLSEVIEVGNFNYLFKPKKYFYNGVMTTLVCPLNLTHWTKTRQSLGLGYRLYYPVLVPSLFLTIHKAFLCVKMHVNSNFRTIICLHCEVQQLIDL